MWERVTDGIADVCSVTGADWCTYWCTYRIAQCCTY